MTVFRKLSPRERRVAILTVAVVLGGLLCVKAVEPAGHRWIELRREVATYERELSRMRGLLAQRDAIDAAMKRVGELESASDSDVSEPDTLLKEIERMAATSGLHLLYLKPRQVKGKGVSGQLGAELKVEGSMRCLGRLLQELQTSVLLLKTQQLTVTVGREAGQVQAVIRIAKLGTRGV